MTIRVRRAPRRGRLFALVLVAAATSAPPLSAQNRGPDIARAYREAHEAEIVGGFAELLSMPNRAADAEDIRRVAAYIRDRLLDVGVVAELLEVDGAPPVVFGELRVPGASRTLGIYVHYDGQAADPANWTHPPFEPTLYTAAMEAGGRAIPLPRPGQAVDPEWRVYARSAGDDKAPIGALLPVLRAFQEGGVTPTSNLVFFFEGEEEAGSPHLERYLEAYRDRIDPIDVWLFFDGPAHQSGRPQLTFGVRGVMDMEVTVYGAARNLHSGHYGNWAPDTPLVLAELLTSMKDADGRVLIEGWYDTVEPIGPEERAALESLPPVDEDLKEELGLLWTEGEPATLAERILVPALTVRGLTSGNTGPLARNVIPNEAVAALGVRLVKGNTPEHMRVLIENHIRAQGFHIVRSAPDMTTRLAYPRIARVTGGEGYPAARTSMSDPAVGEVIDAAAAAADRAFGEGSLVLTPGLGGSLPLYLFSDVLRKPFVNVPVANHDNNQHAPDENLRIANLWYAIELYAALLTMPPRTGM
ncbi:MAG TPA: M20/M25/M40 family metallo-hydrolase [Longimicrobiales bacterium]|jgi:acetylornithine deacetylase/succinyl-diaminopimelate desuccinylase-like protein